ncbi:MAG: aldo/keto reductase [Massilia sp.]|nr:aldo/keto reductase [Massilia sp.]
MLAAVKEYAQLARQNGLMRRSWLAWCYSRPFVASTIIGATSLGQLKENIDAFETTLPGEGIAAIDAIHARMPNPGQ